MKKIILVVILGLILFLILVIIRSPQKILPPQFGKQFSEQKTNCPDPFIFKMPVDMNRVTSILYPGQIRGGEYKAHGGFRFDKSKPSEINVTAPYDAKVIAGARYPINGEIQYTFDFEHPCGVRYRFGHLLILSPKFQKIAEKFPLPENLDSRTTQVSPGVEVKKGEIIATGVGLTKGGPPSLGGYNTFLDWGVYDYRKQNEASQRSDWSTLHAEDPNWAKYYNSETYQYAVCWFDWISPEDKVKVLSLPSADSQSGNSSDYCK